jgi:FtsZ-binding cell division protein ZapB
MHMGLKIAIVMGVIMATMCGGFYWYYQDSQARIATLRENNAKLEVAVDTAESSLNLVKDEMAKVGELNNQLQADLQKAEAYTDELRGKLSRMNLIVEALKDAKTLEGKMNGATAKLWRGFMDDSGNTNDYPLPEWLQRETGTGSESSDQGGKSPDTNSSETETSSTN